MKKYSIIAKIFVKLRHGTKINSFPLASNEKEITLGLRIVYDFKLNRYTNNFAFERLKGVKNQSIYYFGFYTRYLCGKI